MLGSTSTMRLCRSYATAAGCCVSLPPLPNAVLLRARTLPHPSAAPAVCGACGAAAFATIVNGSMSHTEVSGRTTNLAFDLNEYATASNLGAWTGAANSNWMRFALSTPTDDVVAVRLFAGATTQSSSSGFLSVFLSQTPNYNDTATRVVCARGVAIIAGTMGAVTCPRLLGVNYVTVLRNDPAVSDSLVITELQVMTGCECP